MAGRLRVSAASPEHLLVMKVLVARSRDADDITYLVKHINLSSSADVLAVSDRFRAVCDDRWRAGWPK